jgi:hypothetical protein
MNSALTHAGITVTLGRTALPAIDSMACPAVAVEIAPQRHRPMCTDQRADDAAFEAQVADALAAALVEWRADGGQFGRTAAVIPRHQTVLFVILLLASVIMGAVLWNQLRRAHERLLRGEDSAPTQAPLVAPAEQATLMVANDADNTVEPRILTLPLPQNPESRARAILGKLLDLYAAPDATHPVPGGASSIAQVFLCPSRRR